MVMASFVGLATGLAAVAFDQLITGVDAVLFDWLFADVLRTGATWPIYVAPAIGGLLCGVFTYRLARDVRGAGVSPVLVSVETRGGKMNPWTAVTKPTASALTIGSGGSAGTEGPVVQSGAALGSSFAQVLRLSEENTKLLLAAGAAGGIAANAYVTATDRRETERQRGRLSPAISDDVRYLELRVDRGSEVDGRRLSEVALPENAIMVTVRRDGATVIPRGRTRLRADDRVTVIAGATAVGGLRSRFRRPGDGPVPGD